MHFFFYLLVVLMLGFTSPSYADPSQAREVARLNNCNPAAISIYDQKIGADIQTVYKVECNMPQIASKTKQMANALLIRCNGSLCQLLRPVKD